MIGSRWLEISIFILFAWPVCVAIIYHLNYCSRATILRIYTILTRSYNTKASLIPVYSKTTLSSESSYKLVHCTGTGTIRFAHPADKEIWLSGGCQRQPTKYDFVAAVKLLPKLWLATLGARFPSCLLIDDEVINSCFSSRLTTITATIGASSELY